MFSPEVLVSAARKYWRVGAGTESFLVGRTGGIFKFARDLGDNDWSRTGLSTVFAGSIFFFPSATTECIGESDNAGLGDDV